MPVTINQVIEISKSSEFTGTGAVVSPITIATNSVQNSKLFTMPAETIKGNQTGGSAAPQDLTIAEVLALIVKGQYDDDSAAATGGVLTGEVYELTAANIYGMPEGVLKIRKT